jgi:hypothetical protein
MATVGEPVITYVAVEAKTDGRNPGRIHGSAHWGDAANAIGDLPPADIARYFLEHPMSPRHSL